MCTSILIGKNASYENVTIIARNEDCATVDTNKIMRPMRPPFYSSFKGGNWLLGNGLEVSVPSKAYKYCSMPDANGDNEKVDFADIGDHYFFEARGINEKGVAVSATNSMGINNKAGKCDPVVRPGIEESIIVTLILPQIESAIEGIELLGKYVEEYGASEANGICFSDMNEVWYMEIGSGHHWIAVRVPDDSYLIVANSMRIHDVNLNDTKNIRHSKNLYEFTENNQLLKNPDKENFNFSAAFGFQEKMDDPEGNPYYNVDRIWLTQYILNPNKKQNPRDMLNQYPLFMKPESKITLDIVAKVLRSDYKDTELNGKADRFIGTVKTVESHIIIIDKKLRKSIPSCTGGIIWQTLGTPIYSRYVCIIPEITNITAPYCNASNIYDEKSVFWTTQLIAACATNLGQKYASEIKKEVNKYEKNHFKGYYELIEHFENNNLICELKEYCDNSLKNNVSESNSLCNNCLTEFIKNNTDLI